VEIGELLQYYILNTVINFLFKNFIALWRPRDEIFKQKLMTVFSIIILQKFTNFSAIRSWNFQNIWNEMVALFFFATL